jgi:hypothetical protein
MDEPEDLRRWPAQNAAATHTRRQATAANATAAKKADREGENIGGGPYFLRFALGTALASDCSRKTV